MRFLIVACSLMLGACATAPRASQAGPQHLRIAAWNIEHLAERDDSGCAPRTEADYAALRAFVTHLDADVVAFQEVESVAAAERVFTPEAWAIVMEARPGAGRISACNDRPTHNINRQATGFAIRRGVAFERMPDLTALQLGNDDLRSSVDVIVRPHGEAAIRLLVVHLKSRCASGAAGDDCAVLARQAPIVEAWMEARAHGGESFLVLGDFNRRLARPDDVIWAGWDDGAPDLGFASAGQGAQCNPQYPEFIDHIVFNQADVARFGNFREWTYAGARLSDHCPISIDLDRAGE
ncbi:MAG: endonuclease/exonuclease/phosphatase family protein [Hyphomonadaceae bacterium JAD_PAG50586_4]|nr:MAG: endonuclease/exonuclease/phosphatase family protein [Hyphomonadaceae bacterium JAD_PAG50586_4]